MNNDLRTLESVQSVSKPQEPKNCRTTTHKSPTPELFQVVKPFVKRIDKETVKSMNSLTR